MDDLLNANKSILKSMLLDEEKLVTYISISKDLSLHVNISKVLLQRTVELIREEIPDVQLSVNYIVCGVTENNNARTIVCSEQNLSKVNESFINKFFEHIYSATKGCSSIDSAAYVNVNKFDDFSLCSGLIKSKQCCKRTLNEISDLKSNSQDIITPEKSKSLPLTLNNIKQEKKVTKNNENEKIEVISKGKDSQSEPVLKDNLISPPKVVEQANKNKTKVTSTNGKNSQKGIAGFFNKTNNKTEKKEKLSDSKETKVEINISKIKPENIEEIENIIPLETKVKEEQKKDDSNKILNQIKKTSKVDKKRKRVLHVSDSESDNELDNPFIDECDKDENQKANHDSEDEIPSTPTVTNIVIKSGIVNPKKRRKVVDKTYTDDDGYILTKKVEVYESCSDNEEDTEVHKKLPLTDIKSEISPKGKTNRSTKKISPPQKNKQATLTNFFKKI